MFWAEMSYNKYTNLSLSERCEVTEEYDYTEDIDEFYIYVSEME